MIVFFPRYFEYLSEMDLGFRSEKGRRDATGVPQLRLQQHKGHSVAENPLTAPHLDGSSNSTDNRA